MYSSEYTKLSAVIILFKLLINVKNVLVIVVGPLTRAV